MNKVAIAREGGIRVLLELARTCSAEAKAKAASTLARLAMNAENQVTIARERGIGVLLELARTGSAVAKEKA